MDFDLLIRGAEIYDGMGKDSEVQDLGVKGDRIVTLGKLEGGASRVIDGRGLTLSPGFIDIHSHSDYHLLISPNAESKIHQGVTTEIGGNCGYSAAPIWGDVAAQRQKEYLEFHQLDAHWRSLAEYFDCLETTGISVNYAHLVGHNTLRYSVMGAEARPAQTQDLKKIGDGIREGFEQGAIGLSTGLIYVPACFSNLEEVIELGKVCAETNRVFAFHMRSENDDVVEAVTEVVTVGREAQCPVHISHLKTSGVRNWSKIDKIFSLIEKFRDEGGDIECDRYPYLASQTGLVQVLPSRALAGGNRGVVGLLSKSSERKKLKEEILFAHPEEDYFDRICLMELTRQENQKYIGLSLQKAALLEKMEPADFLFDLLLSEEGRGAMIYFSMSEENLERILKKEYVSVASDAGCRPTSGSLAKGLVHPRAFGTFPKVIATFVREKKALSMKEAIYKMTGLPAKRFGLKDRGVIAVSAYADLVLFSRDKIADRATYEKPFQFPQGMEYIFVNGVLTVEKGKHTGARSGRVIRK